MLDRHVAPPFVRSTSFPLLKPEEVVLANNIPVFFIAGGTQDVLKIECTMPAGRWYEEMQGSAYFTAHLLARGTRRRNSFEIANIFDQFGAHLEIRPGFDFVSVAVYVLNKNLNPVLELLLDLLSEPVFSGREFDQMRNTYLQTLSVNNEKTSYLAAKTFRKNIFGDEHPYGTEAEKDDITSLTTDDLARHFSNFVHSPFVFVSGKVTPESRRAIETQFSVLKKGPQAKDRSFPMATPAPSLHLSKEGSVQASVRVGKKSVLRHDADYVPVLFTSHVLGGYFGSRLMKNIREDKGLTYGIQASLVALKHGSYLVIGADVNKENVALTMDEIRKELRTLREEPVPDDELETSRNHFVGSLQAEITTPFAHADKIKTTRLFRLGHDHYQQMINRVESMTADDVMAIANKHFHEDSFCQIAVG